MCRRDISCSSRPNDWGSFVRARHGGRFCLSGHSSDRTPELARSNRTEPLHHYLRQCRLISTGRFHTASYHRAHALEPIAISVFCQPNIADRRVTCWLDIGHSSVRSSCNPARLFFACERVSCIPVLGYREPTSVPQKVRLRSVMVPYGLRF